MIAKKNTHTKTLDGIWRIEVTYGKGYGELHSQKLICRAKLEQNKLKISGVILDISGVGVNTDKAEISGTYKDGELKFVKQYISLLILKLDKSTKLYRTQKGKKIYYKARFNEKNDEFVGTWAYKTKVFGFITTKINGEGTWTMKRE